MPLPPVPPLIDALPNLPIRVIHRSDPSGTTAIWTDYLSAVSAEWKAGPGKGTTVTWPVGEGVARSAGVTDKVNRTAGAIGYVELLNGMQDGLSLGEVRNKAGRSVVPSLAVVTAAAAAMADRVPDDLRYSLVDAAGDDAYPIGGTVWGVFVFPAGRVPDPDAVAFLERAAHAGQAHADGAPTPPRRRVLPPAGAAVARLKRCESASERPLMPGACKPRDGRPWACTRHT